MSPTIAKPECLSPALRVSEGVISTSGMLLNTILALLILFRTESELRPYSRVLLSNCAVDAAFSLSAFVFEI
ncbi:hypothetical protein AAVH_42611, partial [Aphelenchoides avenae]